MSNTRRHRASTRGRSMRRLLTSFVAAATAAGSLSMAAAFATDSGTVDLTGANATTSAYGETADHALVSYISQGASDSDLGASGTGLFEPFVRLQASPTEQGYNTDAKTLQFDETAGTWTHSMLVSQIPVVERNGQRYWELWNDINESNSTPGIDLTDLQIYFGHDPKITGYPFDPTTTPEVYDFSGDIKMHDINSGSGRADLRYLVPLAGIDVPATCGYGNPACTTQFVLYSKWGNADAADPSATDGGFEEWKVKSYPFVNVTKTAVTSNQQAYSWGITKTASPKTFDMNDGDPAQSTTWTVGVTRTGPVTTTDVHGTITVSNPGTLPAVVTGVSDTLSVDGPVSNIDCGAVTFPTTVAANGGSFQCTYDKPLTSATDQTNVATAFVDPQITGSDPVAYEGSAAVTFGAPVVTNGSIDVTDTNGMSWTFSNTGTQQYTQPFACPNDAGHHLNTATITATATQPALSASDAVDVTCHSPLAPPAGMKFATPTHSELVKWSIVKTVEQNGGPQTHDLNLGTVNGPQTVNYHVTATKTVSNETFGVTGTLEVSNTNTSPLDVTLADTGLTPAVAGSSCTLDSTSGTVPAAGEDGPGILDVGYTCAFPSAFPALGTPYKNHASITYSDPHFSTTPVAVTSDDITFTKATLQPGSDADQVTVDDPKAPAGSGFPATIADSTTFPTFQMTYADHGTVTEDNTALFTAGAVGSDTAKVEYTIPAPVVPLTPLAVTCSTDVTSLSLPVANNGTAGAKTLQDAVQLSGLPSGKTTTVTAVLYGPSATSGVRGNTVVATQTFQAGNGKTLTAPVSVSKPGYYTWEISTPGSTSRLQTPLNRLCSDASQTALVHREDYAIVHVPTGFSGPVSSAAERAAASRLIIPSLGIRALIKTATLSHGNLKVPGPSLVGWVNKSAEPTDLIGTTVIAGHVSNQHDVPGALFNLHKIRRGQIIEIAGPDGVQKYKVTGLKKYSRNKALPKSLFDTTAAHRLALVTCTDKVVHNGFFHYTRNLVVIAVPIA